MRYDLESIERYLRRRLGDRDRGRFDRAKRFAEENARRFGDGADACQVRARWLRFLCRRRPVQTDILPEDADFLLHFARLFGLPATATREFLSLSLMSEVWRATSFVDLMARPPELVARLTRVEGWERFDRCRGDGNGVILLPMHGQFSRLLLPYLRHRGHEGLKLGMPQHQLLGRGIATPTMQRLELARQMQAAKRQLARGGIVFNVPDGLNHLDNARAAEFFGRQRRLGSAFAELALTTSACVMPVAHRVSPRGFFVVEFGAPFHDPGSRSTHDERIDALVAQYAAFLREEWRRYPWNIQWKQLRHYCLLPEVEAGSTQGGARTLGERATHFQD